SSRGSAGSRPGRRRRGRPAGTCPGPAGAWRSADTVTAGSPSDRLVGLVLGRPGEQLRRRLTPSLHGEPLWPRYDSPTISPFSSRSIRAAAGFADRPGIVLMSPQIG